MPRYRLPPLAPAIEAAMIEAHEEARHMTPWPLREAILHALYYRGPNHG